MPITSLSRPYWNLLRYCTDANPSKYPNNVKDWQSLDDGDSGKNETGDIFVVDVDNGSTSGIVKDDDL